MGNQSIGCILDSESIKRIQDSFVRLTGVGAQIFDPDGKAVTTCSGGCEFCQELTKGSAIGCERCRLCDINASVEAEKEGKALIYQCHAGLTDFSVPIMVGGEKIGIFAAGQVLTEPMNEERVRELAREMGIDEERYVSAAQKLHVMDPEKIQDIGYAMEKLASVIANMAEIVVNNIRLRKEAETVAQQKSDFLANMSHEIRTPMNAVIGMAEMAMREDLPDHAREYIYQIKAAGKTLLTIINDILDFSKIESGKLDIVEEPYELFSVIHDISSIVNARIGDKNIEFLLDIDPKIPYQLIGDQVRIEQIILNLMSNAVKFTQVGAVTLKMDYKETLSGIDLIVSVIDTGIGIRKENLQFLFQSFQQIDSKRNRTMEGTGLGLALTKNLANLMNGTIWVESEYGKGSTFTVQIPQKVKSMTSMVHLHNKQLKIAGFFNNYYLQESFVSIMKQLELEYTSCNQIDEIGDTDFFFVEYPCYTADVKDALSRCPKTECSVVIDSRFQQIESEAWVSVLPKPVSVIHIASILNHEKNMDPYDMQEQIETTFLIPDVNLLIVDDNEVNLTVVEGLLRVLMPNIVTASSGKEALELVTEKPYDLIFMDHMMPEMDGVEAAKRIRAMGEPYSQIPIVAFTANALNDAKEMLLNEGLDDFISKPIEIREIYALLKKWIPKEKIIPITSRKKKVVQFENFKVAGLNTKDGIRYTGSLERYKRALKDYHDVIEEKAARIERLEAIGDFDHYTIEVHALKSASKLIGANELAKIAARLEECGRKRDCGSIYNDTCGMLSLYRSYLPILAPIAEEFDLLNSEKLTVEEATNDLKLSFLDELESAMEELDLEAAEQICDEIRKYRFAQQEKVYVHELLTCVEKVDFESAMETVKEWRILLT